MKKWLPIFLIALLFTQPVRADENAALDNKPREIDKDTPEPETTEPNTNTKSENTQPETNNPDKNNQETERNSKYEYYEKPYEAPYETPVEEPYEVPLEEPVEEPTYEAPIEEPTYETPIDEPVEEPIYETPIEEPVIEPPTETPVEIDIIEADSYEISGEVRVDGKEQNAVEVMLKGVEEQKVKTNKSGIFTFKNLAPGAYEIILTYKDAKEPIEPREVIISDRDKININFDVQSDTEEQETKKEKTLVEDIEREEDRGLPLYLKWVIVIGSLLMPMAVILYFVFRKV